jgi:ATP-dependent DNA helicase RecQ
MDHERIEHLAGQREQEWQEVQDYIDSRDCLMAFLGNALDDPAAAACGHCSVCLGEPVLPVTTDRVLAAAAGRFLKHAELPFIPKKQVAAGAFPEYGFKGNLPSVLQAEEGRMLSRWRDAGWGGLVAEDKEAGHFRDELVVAVTEMISTRWQPEPAPEWVTCVPSRNHPDLVPDFARRLAAQLGLPFHGVITKVRDNAPQKHQRNRFHQCRNLDGVFAIQGNVPKGPVLLVDDRIDSGWTVTVLAALLQQAGSGAVFPVALAATSSGE